VQIGTLLNGITNVSLRRRACVTTVVSTGPGTMPCITGFNGSTDATVSTAAACGLPKMIHPALPVFFPVVTHCGRSQSLYWTILGTFVSVRVVTLKYPICRSISTS
jgi:hypothetical protein